MGLMRILVVIHRYLGVLVGLVMMLWCLTGFVMMYQSFPETTGEERLAGLAPLELPSAGSSAMLPFLDVEAFSAFRIEMMAGAPVLRASQSGAPSVLYDLAAGEAVERIDADQAGRIASGFAQAKGVDAAPRVETIEQDQWSIQVARRHQPLYRVHFDDAAGMEIYVSGQTGEVIQDTTIRERVLGWIGVVPHWLYPTLLRQHSGAWVQVVIWASVIGTFLTVTGVYLGVSRWITRPKGRVSPYRGLFMWHHMIGLVFGVLTLTWVFSGLLTMNPWGWLESSGGAVAGEYSGEVTGREVKDFLAAADEAADGRAVQLSSSLIGGRLFVSANTADGGVTRLDGRGAPAPLDRADIERGLNSLAAPVASLEVMEQEDAFYYGHHRAADLPVWRAVLADDQSTRLYIDAATGQVRRVVDATARQSRWWRTGLHDMDFPGLRAKPFWYVAVGLLLAGVTAVCFTGTWMAWRRVKLDLRMARLRAGRTAPRRTGSVRS